MQPVITFSVGYRSAPIDYQCPSMYRLAIARRTIARRRNSGRSPIF
ncbi:hypothetical protein [Oxynema aestuarii]|uniref:Uncharacterized protein n=1 Tax=Oxynema aestuarii AP17 TaxID=2064643 RepID=A0A6H1TV11_9CYAN|nr:hypothetical protein [Oxynema aestuarii]QIZ69987.1 hypothetical protein HCG48_04850 [Oxynema aestuarii AP17]